MQQQTADNLAADSQTSLINPAHCPYRFPAIVLTHTTTLFLNLTSVATFVPAAHETVFLSKAGGTRTQFASSLEYRGPPAITL